MAASREEAKKRGNSEQSICNTKYEKGAGFLDSAIWFI